MKLRPFFVHLLRGIALGMLLIMAYFGRLTMVPSRPGTNWTFAVVAGEYGHWGALAAVIIGAVAWATRKHGRVLSLAIVALALVTTLLLLKPAMQAWRIGGGLRPHFAANFGPEPRESAGFSIVRAFRGDRTAPVPVQTHEVSPTLPLDFYAAQNVPAGRAAPCVIVVHGGGWHAGNRGELPRWNHWLAQRGYAVAAVSYRLAPKHQWPAPREDVLAAIAFLKQRAPELGLDPARLVLFGRSAGAQIALVTAYVANDPAIRGVVALYGPSDLVFGYVNTHEDDMIRSPSLMRRFLGGTPDSARANYESASALNHVTKASPPTLLVHGENDPLVWHRHSVRLDARLAELGVPHAFVSLPWATHAFDFNPHGPGGQLTAFALEWFLAGVTR